ncbi:MAG TPA: 4Fe-4S double cluster binding domain-containing protein [candidate division Zixibacteria bacterium]
MTKTDLSFQIQTALLKKGASLVGFADLGDLLPAVRHSKRFAISIAVALDKSAVADIKNGPTKEYHSEYKKVNVLLSNLAKYAAEMIKDLGYEAIPKEPTGVGIDQKTQTTILPHKTVATKAGLGWIGKCALLVTGKYGSAVRLTTVLTDALLETPTPILESQCGDCTICVDSCPGNAPRGKNWNSDLHRNLFFDVFACEKTARKQGITKVGIDDTICGICIAVCPWTIRYTQD